MIGAHFAQAWKAFELVEQECHQLQLLVNNSGKLMEQLSHELNQTKVDNETISTKMRSCQTDLEVWVYNNQLWLCLACLCGIYYYTNYISAKKVRGRIHHGLTAPTCWKLPLVWVRSELPGTNIFVLGEIDLNVGRPTGVLKSEFSTAIQDAYRLVNKGKKTGFGFWFGFQFLRLMYDFYHRNGFCGDERERSTFCLSFHPLVS